MSKRKDKKKKRNVPSQQQAGNISCVQAVVCYKDSSTVLLTDCKVCDNYLEPMTCKLCGKERKIEVIKLFTPMQFNRNMFQNITDTIREDSINYYFKTDIMNEVNRIQGFPNYTEYKQRYMRGMFFAKEPDVIKQYVLFDKFTITMYLQKTIDASNCDIMIDKEMYVAIKPFVYPGEYEILLYLYNMHSLDGFADYKINDVPYKVTIKPVEDCKPDMVIARKDDRLIIGRIPI